MAKAQTFTTPRGTAIYPWLNKADTKFGDPVYKLELAVEEGEDTTKFTDSLEDIFSDFYAETQSNEEGKFNEFTKEDLPFYAEDGQVFIRAKLNKLGKNKAKNETWENKIAFFDPKGTPIPGTHLPAIGGGSILRMSVEVRPYSMPETVGKGKAKVTNLKCGLSLRIKAVMVIEARQEAAQQTASQHGFEEEEGGYSYDPASFDETAGGDEPANAENF